MREIEKTLGWLKVILSDRYGHDFEIQLIKKQLIVSLSKKTNKIIFPKLISAFYEVSKRPLPCVYFNVEKSDLTTPIDKIMPQPGISEVIECLVSYNKEETIVNYDILGLTYWMLSRQEEVGAINLDSHERFPAIASHAYQHDYLERPIVDEWLIILGQIIEKTWPGITLKQHEFSMKVSHDVDRPSRFGFSAPKQLIRKVVGSVIRKNFFDVLYAPIIWLTTNQKLHNKDPYNTFDWLMDISEKNNLTSAFYFICGTTNATYDANYTLADPAIKELMRHIFQRGHEIGLHPSYATYQNQEAFSKEANILKGTCQDLEINQSAFGGRMHYLRWEPSTLMFWEKAEMAYDSTLSYADRPGFRCGTCFEYPAINPVTKEMLKLRIRPLVAMECSVTSPNYLGLGEGKAALDKFTTLKEACRKVDGCFTLLWHNSELNKKQKELYQMIIEQANHG